MRTEAEQVAVRWPRAARPGSPGSPRRATGQAAVLRLQRLAGNAAVRTLLTGQSGPTVHRCGPVPCDCPPEERAAAAPVQRQAVAAPPPRAPAAVTPRPAASGTRLPTRGTAPARAAGTRHAVARQAGPAAPQFGDACQQPDPCRHDRCEPDENDTIRDDLSRAVDYVDAALNALHAAPLADETERALDWFFTDHRQATVNVVRARLGCIRACLTETQGNSRWGCHPDDDALAYVCMPASPVCGHRLRRVCLTSKHFGGGDRRRAETVVHECAHREGMSLGRPQSVPDIYEGTLRFLNISTDDALRNSDSYALFVGAIAQGTRISVLPNIGLSGGTALAEGGQATWFARLYLGTELQHPVLGMFSPTLGLGISLIGEPAGAPARAAGGPPPLVSLLPGVRIGQQRPGAAGTGYAAFFGGPSLSLSGDSPDLGMEAGVAVGYRWRWLDVSGGVGYAYDPGRAAGQQGLVTVGAAVTFTPGDIR